jgi:hypothetical protein
MAKSGSKINESLQSPLVRQFSVFLENEDSEFARDVLFKEGYTVFSQKDISH